MPEPIDWTGAYQQVGDDKEFLTEVLNDLLSEADTAETEIEQGINDQDFVAVKKAAHRIKGSASYLCCTELMEISLTLQDLGLIGDKGDYSNGGELWQTIRTKFEEYKVALATLKRVVEENLGSG